MPAKAWHLNTTADNRFFATTSCTTHTAVRRRSLPINHHHFGAPSNFTSSLSLFINHHPTTQTTPALTTPYYNHNIQTRTFAGRKDRAKTSNEVRKPTKKQLKTYHKRRRALEYERTKHSKPNSKAIHRRLEDKEHTQRLIEIAQEEEVLKKQLAAYYDKVNELQSKIESSPKFVALLNDPKISKEDIKLAARDAAKKAANKSDTPHPPLPSWWQDRMTYDWGDALVDDLMGNSSDLTSSSNPSPVYMGGEYGRLKRKVQRLVRGQREEERLRRLGVGGDGNGNGGERGMIESGSANASNFTNNDSANGLPVTLLEEQQGQKLPADIQQRPSTNNNTISDKLLSDLIRSHRDANGKRTTPIGLAASLELLHELHIPLSTLQTYSYVSLLTCCKSPWEARELNELRKEYNIRSNEYYWSAFVDVYARSGDYRGAERVLDEMLEESKLEYEDEQHTYAKNDGVDTPKVAARPLSIPPLPAYTSFFSSCYKLISRSDVHQSIKADAANRAWERWKEMRIHSIPPDVMSYGALMRIFAAQGRPEQAIDLLDEVMMQLMMPVNAEGVMNNKKNGSGNEEETLRSIDGDDDGWYDKVDGETVRVKPTTLLFTSALKAVAKSHEIATKFNGGNSRKNRRRESITSYHGRLTRKIVIMAEQAEVKQDDGFVAALMLCAAAAGDSSTARAIYLASKVRRLDHLRTCGGKDHLKRLQGLIPEDEKQKLLGGGGGSVSDDDGTKPALSSKSSKAPALRTIEEEFEEEHAAYEHREYGTDTRILSALMLSHAKAMESKGLGSMWAGRYNRGYLCPNSLRYIEAYNLPQYENMAIPGLDSVKAGLSPEGAEPEDFSDDGSGKTSKALRKKHKFNIKQIMDDGYGNRKDEQDAFFDGFDPDENEDWRLQLRRGEGEDRSERDPEVTRDWLDDQLFGEHEMKALTSSDDDGLSTLSYKTNQATPVNAKTSQVSEVSSSDYSNDFDSDSDDDDDSDDEDDQRTGLNPHERFVRKQLQQRPQSGSDRDALVKAMTEVTNDPKLADDLIPKDFDGERGFDDEEGDFDPGSYFDEEAFLKLMEDTERGIDETKGGDAEELNSIPGVASNNFAAFKAHLKKELVAEGSANDVDETEARQLFDMMRTYYDEGSPKMTPDAEFMNNGEIVSSKSIASSEQDDASMEDIIDSTNFASMKMAKDQLDSLKMDSLKNGNTPQMQRSPMKTIGGTMANETIYADDYIEWANSQTNSQTENIEQPSMDKTTKEISEVEPSTLMDFTLPKQYRSPLAQQEVEPHIRELQQNLPGLPMNRIEKVSDEFARTLGYPSILRLTVAIRENMPEAFSPQCLTRVNLANAKHVMVSYLSFLYFNFTLSIFYYTNIDIYLMAPVSSRIRRTS